MLRNKLYRIILTVLLSVFTLAMLTSAIFSLFYEDAVIRYLKKYLDDHLTTQISVEKIRFRLLKGFPHATFELSDLVILSGENFSPLDFQLETSDTLLKAENVTFQFNFIQLINQQYELKKTEITHGYLNVLFDRNNRNNLSVWEIKEDSMQDGLSVNLNNIQLNDLNINLVHLNSQVSFYSSGEKIQLKGAFQNQDISFEVSGNLMTRLFQHKQNVFLQDVKTSLDIQTEYGNGKLSIPQGKITVNDIPVKLSALMDSHDNPTFFLSMDIPEFNLDDMVPLLGVPDREIIPELLTIHGKGNLKASMTGSLAKSGNVTLDAGFEINNGTIENNKTGSKIDRVHLTGSAEGQLPRGFTVHVEQFSSSLSDGSLLVSGGSQHASETGNQMYVSLNSTVRLSELYNFIVFKPVEFMNGQVNATANLMIPAGGFIPDSILTYISESNFTFDNVAVGLQSGTRIADISGRLSYHQQLMLHDVSLEVDANQYLINGNMRNLYKYLKYNDIIYSDLSVKLDKLDLSSYFNKSSSRRGNEPNIPPRMDMKAQIHAAQLQISKFGADDVDINMHLFKENVIFNNFSMRFYDGTISGNASIEKSPSGGFAITCNTNNRDVNISELFGAFNNFAQDFIVKENIKGRLHGTVGFYTEWNEVFRFQPTGMKALANIEIRDGELIDFEPLMQLSDYFDVEELAHVKFSTIKNLININNRQVHIPEMEIYSSAFNIAASGTHSFDQVFDYRLRVLLSEVMFRRTRNRRKEINEFYIRQNLNDQLTVPIIIAGTPGDISVQFDKQRAFSLSRENENTFSNPDNGSDDFVIEWDDPQSGTEAGQAGQQEKNSDFIIEWEEE